MAACTPAASPVPASPRVLCVWRRSRRVGARLSPAARAASRCALRCALGHSGRSSERVQAAAVHTASSAAGGSPTKRSRLPFVSALGSLSTARHGPSGGPDHATHEAHARRSSAARRPVMIATTACPCAPAVLGLVRSSSRSATNQRARSAGSTRCPRLRSLGGSDATVGQSRRMRATAPRLRPRSSPRRSAATSRRIDCPRMPACATAYRMRVSGMSFAAIGRELRVSAGTARRYAITGEANAPRRFHRQLLVDVCFLHAHRSAVEFWRQFDGEPNATQGDEDEGPWDGTRTDEVSVTITVT